MDLLNPEVVHAASMEDLFWQHALTPAEVTLTLEQLFLAIDTHPDVGKLGLTIDIIDRSNDATFNLRIEFNNFIHCQMRTHILRTLDDQSPLKNRDAYETVPGFLIECNSTGLTLRHVPKTREMLRTLKRAFATSGMAPFEDAVWRFDDIAPIDRLFAAINVTLPPSYHFRNMPDLYPRMYAELGSWLRLTGDIPASEVPYYALRELGRIKNNEYQALPTDIIEAIDKLTYIKETPHLAIKGSNRGKMAYTENRRKGAADTQSVMKPGKYLRRVLKDNVSDQKLKEMVAEMQSHAKHDVRIVTTPGEAADVYMNGPNSCMSHGEERFDRTFDLDDDWRHPIEALFWPDGSGDIHLVYVEVQNRPAARALIHTKNRAYPCVYASDWAPGARETLEAWLDENGYRQASDALDGARIPRIELRNGTILCPYIDTHNRGVEVHNDHLVIDGPHEAEYSAGFIDPDGVIADCLCQRCEERVDEDETTYIEREGIDVCQSCLDDYVWALTDDGVELVREDDCEMIDGSHIYGGVEFGYVHDSASDYDLERAGLCRVERTGEIMDKDGCTQTDDGEWVEDDEIRDTHTAPSPNLPVYEDYIRVDTDDVHRTEDCVWMADHNEWWWDQDRAIGDEYTIEHVQNYQVATEVEDNADAA
ncbi:hypothetical protein [Vreelandella massiliensis]|uniref:hypothetical protein n=1 Tax=Vreelandella massiliensis TaxID=1816686 RepID=UPI00096A5689|nr:hypothetical protein [Halomonas massiliensis]